MKFSVYSKGKKIPGHFFLKKFHDDEEIGVFESLRTYPRGKIFREKEHLTRFKESLQTLANLHAFSSAELSRELHLALNAYTKESGKRDKTAEYFLRLSFWQDQIFVMVGTRQHPESIYQNGVTLSTSPVRRTFTNAQSAQVKTSAYHNAFLASLEIKPEDTYEWIFLDAQGYVTEVRIGNLFVVRNGILLTPPEDGILNGVTRGVVLECALRNRLRVQEIPLTRHEIFNAQEAFLTNTSWQILPVSKLDGRRIGSSVPGPVTSLLQKTFRDIVQEECL